MFSEYWPSCRRTDGRTDRILRLSEHHAVKLGGFNRKSHACEFMEREYCEHRKEQLVELISQTTSILNRKKLMGVT